MKKKFASLFLIFLAASLFGIQSVKAQQKGSLVIFVENEKQIPDSTLEQIRTKMEKMEVELQVKKATDGLPKEVSLLPVVFFQNHLGRSLYRGRYLNLGRMENFVRTSRYLPSQKAKNPKTDLMVLKQGRATIGAPIKVTELSGKVKGSFDQKSFQKESIQALGEGMSQFSHTAQLDFPDQGRLFYYAVYPYRSGSKLFLTVEMYSMFNCKKTIFKTETALEGKWSERKQFFRETGAMVEKEILRQIQQSTIGDAFVAVDENTTVKSWQGLGLELPPAPESSFKAITPGTQLPQKWVVDGPIAEDLPMVQFNFMAPMDYYAGEAAELIGNLDLAPDLSVNGASGTFTVPVKSINMGDEMLTQTAQESKLLMGQFPEGSFVFEKGIGPGESLQDGQELQLIANGKFMLKGIGIPLEVTAEIKPLLNADGEIRLLVSTHYQITLQQNFDIHGPDGPAPAADTMEFTMNFFMKPAGN